VEGEGDGGLVVWGRGGVCESGRGWIDYPIWGGYDWYSVTKMHRMSKLHVSFRKKPLIVGFFGGKIPIKIRHPTGLGHPVDLIHDGVPLGKVPAKNRALLKVT